MFLNDRQIRSAMRCQDVTISPVIEGSLQPTSWDVHLGNRFTFDTPGTEHIIVDPWDSGTQFLTTVEVPDDGFIVIAPGQCMLATTLEWVALVPEIAARLEGKSSVGRNFLQIHNAGFIDQGFKGNITLELVNWRGRPIRLRPGMAIGQLSFTRGIAPDKPYGHEDLGSHYQGQVSTTPPAELAAPKQRHLKLVGTDAVSDSR